MPSCIAMTRPPPAASASPATSPTATMSVLRTRRLLRATDRNRVAPYPARRRMQHRCAPLHPWRSRAILREVSVARKPTAADALRLARRRFLAPERLDMSALADELGVNRVTLYRWVGSRDQLLVETVWTLAERAFEEAQAGLDVLHGPERVVRTVTRFLD